MSNTPMPAAHNAPVNALDHKVASIFSSCLMSNGAGKVPSLSELDNSLAPAASNCPSICAVPPHILSWIVGAVISCPPTKIAIWVQIFSAVISQNNCLPSSLSWISTTGCPSCELPTLAIWKYAPSRTSPLTVAGIQLTVSLTNISSIV